MAKIYEDKQRGSLRDTFGLVAKQSPAAPRQSNMNNNVNVVITDVAWSKPQRYNQHRSSSGEDSNATEMMDDNNPHHPHQHQNRHRDSSPVLVAASVGGSKKKEEVLDSIIAAAGSNGVVVVWSARRAFFEIIDGSSSSMANQQPEAILSQHSRAVNRLAWHPRRSGLLLTASQVRSFAHSALSSSCFIDLNQYHPIPSCVLRPPFTPKRIQLPSSGFDGLLTI